MIELEFQPRGFFRSEIHVNVGGQPLTTIQRSPWGGNGHFELEGVQYEVRRRFSMRLDAQLLRGREELASARHRSFFSSRIEVDWGDGPHELVRRFLGRTVELRRQGQVLGQSRRHHFRRTRYLECSKQVEPAVAVFLGWLFVTLDERRTAAAS